ncbi:MAG TPA: glycoside hydrolase family 31 protein [Candidatus Limnocylindrales bacterium]|nr:glycoside hydrolase family 31 protein [Candidatus Limnocylindrales bacterium]
MDRPRLVAAPPARPRKDFWPRDPVSIRRVEAVRRTADRLRVDARDDLDRALPIEIWPVAPDIVRLHVGRHPGRRSRLTVDSAPTATPWALEERGGGWTVRTPAIRLEVDRDPYRIRLLDGDDRERFAEDPLDRDIRGQYHHFPSGRARGLHWLTARLRPGEALFGLGEHFGAVNRRGQAFASWTVDAFGVRSDRAYKNLPLLLSSAGCAVFLDMTAPLYWDLGEASVSAWQVTARADHLRVYLIAGDGPADQLRGYHRLTGAPRVPPAFSFGLWMSRWGYRNRDELMSVARRLRAEGIPCDVLHLDPYWLRYHEGHHGDLTWDESAFPDPAGMIAELKAMGFRLSLWESPYLPLDSDLCREGAARGFLVRDGHGSPALVTGFVKPSAAVDFTNPQAVEWFKERNRRLLAQGVAVLKTDFGEDLPRDAIAFDHTPAEELHNLYPLLYQRAVFEVTEEVKGYGLVWARSGYAGSQRFPLQWGGDPACTFTDMAASLRGALSWILSGMAFASFDMGGFFGLPRVQDPPPPELYVRWCQMGFFFSHARTHGHTAPREPWAYGEQALAIFREYARLRYRLLPYLYNAALRAPDGVPLVRPLVFDHPDDRATHDVDDQYLLGPDLLVAPMFEAEGTRAVYLPRGAWYDFWTDARHEGGRWIDRRADLRTLPLFVRAGAVLPMGPDLAFSDERAWDPLTFEVYLGDPGRRELEVRDDRRRIAVRVEQTAQALTLHAGLAYPAAVRVHGAGATLTGQTAGVIRLP